MARLPRAYPATSSGKTTNSARQYRSDSSYANRYPPETRGVLLAQEYFDTYGFPDECVAEADDSYYHEKEIPEPVPVQMELALETPEELAERLRYDIKRFERAYDSMALYAVRWKQLMEDVETNPQLKKMFKDIQLMRKLSGSEFE